MSGDRGAGPRPGDAFDPQQTAESRPARPRRPAPPDQWPLAPTSPPTAPPRPPGGAAALAPPPPPSPPTPPSAPRSPIPGGRPPEPPSAELWDSTNENRTWNRRAVAAGIIGLLGPIVPFGVIIAVFLGITALSQIRSSLTPVRGKGLAITGIVAPVVWIVAFIGLVVVIIASTPSNQVHIRNFAVGQCFDETDSFADDGETFRPYLLRLDCSVSHYGVVVDIIEGNNLPEDLTTDQVAALSSACEPIYAELVQSSTIDPLEDHVEVYFLSDLKNNVERIICARTRIDNEKLPGT